MKPCLSIVAVLPLVAIECIGGKRTGVVVRGTTVAPGFTPRQSGKRKDTTY
jgi:hypothetical protein